MEHIENYIIIAVLLLLVGGIIFYLVRAKKKRKSCMGCSRGGSCGGKCSCGSSKKIKENDKKRISEAERQTPQTGSKHRPPQKSFKGRK